MTRYAQLTDLASNAALEAAKPFEDFAISLVGVLARTTGRLPSPTFATVPVLVAEHAAAYSNLLSAQREFLTRLHSASTSPSVTPPKDVRVKSPATKRSVNPAATSR